MSTTITNVVTATSIKTAEFVEIIISTSTIYTSQPPEVNISSSYRKETITLPDNRTLTFTPAGGLLSIGEQHRDLQASSFDTSITLDGIAYDNIYNVLAYPTIRGSKVTIWRGFYNDNHQLTDVYQRFTGIIVSYVITENADPSNKYYSVVLNASSYKTILSNNIGGRRTNSDDWARTSPGDTSMDNVALLNNAYFNFGVKV